MNEAPKRYSVNPPRALVRSGGEWAMRPADEQQVPLEVVISADQVQGASPGVSWVLRGGYNSEVSQDIAEEICAAGFGAHVFKLPDIAAPKQRVMEPAYDLATARLRIEQLEQELVEAGGEIDDLRDRVAAVEETVVDLADGRQIRRKKVGV